LYAQGPKKDEAKAAKLFRKACDNFGMAACYNLGLLYSVGSAAVQDKTKAVALFENVCSWGKNDKGDALVLDMKGCNAAGELYAKGDGVAQDTVKAAALFQKACDAGLKDGCRNRRRLP